MPYRVLHLISPLGLYGAERVILNLSLEMKESLFIPIVGILMENMEPTQELEATAKELGIMTLNISLGSKFSPLNIFRLKNSLKRNNIAIVHSHGYRPTIMAYIPALLLNIPLITTCHLWSKEDWKLGLYFKLESIVFKFLPIVIGVSEEICDQIAAKGVKKSRIRLIHNGINLNNYRRFSRQPISVLREELDIQDSDFVIGTIGRLTAQKAYHYLLNAIKILVDKGTNVKCIILGDGYLRRELEKKKEWLGLHSNIFFLGFREDAVEVLDIIDVFVMTSIDEGLPMALLEAMAKAKPVITTPVGAIDRVIDHGSNGLLYDVGDINTLADHLLKVKNDRGFAKKLGKGANDTVEKQFSSKSMAKKYLDIYRETHLAK